MWSGGFLPPCVAAASDDVFIHSVIIVTVIIICVYEYVCVEMCVYIHVCTHIHTVETRSLQTLYKKTHHIHHCNSSASTSFFSQLLEKQIPAMFVKVTVTQHLPTPTHVRYAFVFPVAKEHSGYKQKEDQRHR